jgi:hypothetical protein
MAPTLRKLALGLPMKMIETGIEAFAGRHVSAEVARALPDSKGGEEPKDLQRWRTDMYEMFTTNLGESTLFYSADQWVTVKLMLETAGPVSVSTRAEILPVLSGKGRLLITNIPQEWVLPKGSRLYYGAENVNRVGFTVQPIPWMEQISMEIRRVASSNLVSAKEMIRAILGRGKPLAPVPTDAKPFNRLTPMSKPGKVL